MFQFSDFIIDTPTETKYGIDRLNVIIHLMPLLDGKDIKNSFNRFKSYLVSQIKRGITPQEEINLSEAILNYVKSDPATDERMKAMDYLFGLEFLTENN